MLREPAETSGNPESGNMLFMILIAVVLLGLLTAAIQFTSRPEGANIDAESMAIRVTEAQRQAGEFERAVMFIIQNGASENDIRFAHPSADADYGTLPADTDDDSVYYVFSRKGGGATYRQPPADVNDGSQWEFYGGTHLPGVGSDKPDLVAVLPNVTQQFCDRVNEVNGQSGTPEDTGSSAAAGNDAGTCVNIGTDGRINDTRQFYDPPATANTVDTATFEQDPVTAQVRTAMEACVRCALDGENHYYHVLMAR